MGIPIIDSRELPNNWRIVDDKLGNMRERGLPFRFPYIGAFSQHLAEWFIRVYSKHGDTILDPFSGRGTVAMQALWHDRHVVCNDLSPYSNTLCHSILWPPYMNDVRNYLKILEEYVLGGNCKIDKNYAGKGSVDDVAKLYHPDTFGQIIKLRNLLNHHSVLLGRGYDTFITDIDKDAPDGSKSIIDAHRRYDHEIVMFIRMVMSQCLLNSSSEVSFNGIKIRGTDNTNIRSLLKFYQTMGETPQHINIFNSMVSYIEKMDLDSIGIKDRYDKSNRNLISCDARRLDLPDKSIDMVLTSPPYFDVLNYGKSNWLRLWSINNIGDPLVKSNNVGNIDESESSEMHGKIYDRTTDSTGSTVANPMSYSAFTGQYLKELYRVLKDDGVAIIVVGDYGNKRKVDAWRIVVDRADIFGFNPQTVIMDELNKDVKSSTQFNLKQGGGKNDYDVCVVIYKGKYERRNDPKDIDFRWGAKYTDSRQLDIENAWGI